MIRRPVEDIIREEIETVRARRIILDQLEGGLMTGAELREKITTDIKAKMVAEGANKKEIAKVRVTSPKLYHNTQRLEELGIIVSWKQSQYRLFELDPRAVLPVRRALEITKPLMYVTSLNNPEDQRPFVQWLVNNPYFNPKQLLVFVEAVRWTRGVSRIMDRFIPDDAFRVWTTVWKEVPEQVMGGVNEMEYGNLQKTYEFIENEILNHLSTHNIIFDLTLGPPLITLAMAKLATEYSAKAFQVSRYDVDDAEVSYY